MRFKVLLLVVFGGCILVILSVRPSWTPSSWLDWSALAASEWLGWIGLVGVFVAIWQIVLASSATQAATAAVNTAVQQIARADVSIHLQSAIGSLRRAIESIDRRDFDEACLECDSTLELLSQAKVNTLQLGAENLAIVQEAITYVGSAGSTVGQLRALCEIDPLTVSSLVDSLKQHKYELMSMSASLRITVRAQQ